MSSRCGKRKLLPKLYLELLRWNDQFSKPLPFGEKGVDKNIKRYPNPFGQFERLFLLSKTVMKALI